MRNDSHVLLKPAPSLPLYWVSPLLAVRGLRCWLCGVSAAGCAGSPLLARALSSSGEQAHSRVAVLRLLITVAFLVAEYRFSGARASVPVGPGPQGTGSGAVAHGLSCSAACGIFPDQRSNSCL